MEYKVLYMWARDVSSDDKLYMVIHHQRVPSDLKWLAVIVVHVLDAAKSLRNILKTMMQMLKVIDFLYIVSSC